MRFNLHRRVACLRLGLPFAFLATLALAAAGLAAPQTSPTPPRSRLRPKLVPGQVMRYQIELQTRSATARSGSFQDPEGPSQLLIVWDAIVRMEVLASPASGPPAPAPPAVRLRTTYEKSTATVRSDTPDPAAAGIEMQYAQLAGRSLEFTLAADGRVLAISGLDEVVKDEKIRAAARLWITQLLGANSAPAAGVSVAQRWSSEQPADSLPLAGMAWRIDSTYLRNESCQLGAEPVSAAAGAANASPATSAPAPATPPAESCAVILAELSLVKKRSLKDPTPDDYRRNGLRTSGHWSGAARGLTYVSLASGWVASTTQTGSEQMDVTIAKPPALSLRYSGTVETRSSVSLLPPASPETR